MGREPETGESTSSIIARGDDMSWPQCLAELETGATLLRVPKLRRAYPDRGAGAYGSGITDTRVRKLERDGVLRNIGVDRYALVAGAGARFKTELTPIGEQFVIPGCEQKHVDSTKPEQLKLW